MTTFVSYFSKEYVISGLASMQSALANNPNSDGILVCIDHEGQELLRSLSLPTTISIIPFEQLRKSKAEFDRFMQSRSRFESIISIKPTLLKEISDYIIDNQFYIYLDTDIYFFDSIENFLIENQDKSFIVFQHMYLEKQQTYPFGKYNAGLVILKKDSAALGILTKWSKLCREWCYLRTEPGRYADQGYLDQLTLDTFALGAVSTSINLGMHYPLTRNRLTRKHKRILVNQEPLICFHFHGLRIGSEMISTGLNRYGFKLRNLYIFKIIYKPVLNYLISSAKEIEKTKPKEKFFFQENTPKFERGKIVAFIGMLKSTLIKTNSFYS